MRKARGQWTPEVTSAEGAETPGEGPEPRGDPAGGVGKCLEGGRNPRRGWSRGCKLRDWGRKGKPQSRAAWANTPREANGKEGAQNQYLRYLSPRQYSDGERNSMEERRAAGDRGGQPTQSKPLKGHARFVSPDLFSLLRHRPGLESPGSERRWEVLDDVAGDEPHHAALAERQVPCPAMDVHARQQSLGKRHALA